MDDDEWGESELQSSQGEHSPKRKKKKQGKKVSSVGSPMRSPHCKKCMAIASPKSKAKSTTPKSKGKKNEEKKCLACDSFRYRSGRWCQHHYNAAVAMRKQAVDKKKFDVEMKKDEVATDRMKLWETKNPVGSKWSRKQFVDFVAHERRTGTEASRGTKAKDSMMTKKRFRAWARYHEGYDTDEITEEWAELEENSPHRDNLGRKGVLRLHVDQGEVTERMRKRFISSEAVDGERKGEEAHRG